MSKLNIKDKIHNKILIYQQNTSSKLIYISKKKREQYKLPINLTFSYYKFAYALSLIKY